MNTLSLADVEEGETVKVSKISGSGAIKQRLMDMGIARGVPVTVERYAPLKDPIQVTLRGYSLAIRVSEARLIAVSRNQPIKKD